MSPALIQDFFQAPEGARLVVDSPTITEEQTAFCRNALEKYGVAIVDKTFNDPESQHLVDLAATLGTPHTHSATRGGLWDVKPTKGLAKPAVSETQEKFEWHTDCAYESDPARYFALDVLHPDRCGGGNLKALKAEIIMESLSETTVEALKKPIFNLRVPPEFYKGIDFITEPLISQSGKIRFRKDILTPTNDEAKAALEELYELLDRADVDGLSTTFGPDTMKEGTTILFDNAKWLHARTAINDPNRHLRRLRWEAEVF